MPLRCKACCFGCCSCWDPNKMKKDERPPDAVFSSLRTGDIILFRSDKFAGKALRVSIPGEPAFEHVGMVIRRSDPEAVRLGHKGLWLLEAVGGSGVQFDPLPMKIFLCHHDFAHHVAIRRLRDFKRDAAFEKAALDFAKGCENIAYSAPGALIKAGVVDCINPEAAKQRAVEQRQHAKVLSYFCSSLVAHGLQALGILRSDTVDWSVVIPSDFATAGGENLLENYLNKKSKGGSSRTRYSKVYLIKWPGSKIAMACNSNKFLSKAEAKKLYDPSDYGEWDQEWLKALLRDHYDQKAADECRAAALGADFQYPQGDDPMAMSASARPDFGPPPPLPVPGQKSAAAAGTAAQQSGAPFGSEGGDPGKAQKGSSPDDALLKTQPAQAMKPLMLPEPQPSIQDVVSARSDCKHVQSFIAHASCRMPSSIARSTGPRGLSVKRTYGTMSRIQTMKMKQSMRFLSGTSQGTTGAEADFSGFPHVDTVDVYDTRFSSDELRYDATGNPTRRHVDVGAVTVSQGSLEGAT